MKEKNKEIIKLLDGLGYKKPLKEKNGYRVVVSKSNNKKGLLDNHNQKISDFVYDGLSDVDDNEFCVGRRNYTRGYMKIIEKRVKELHTFHDLFSMSFPNEKGYGLVQKEYRGRLVSGFMDTSGNEILLNKKDSTGIRYLFGGFIDGKPYLRNFATRSITYKLTNSGKLERI